MSRAREDLRLVISSVARASRYSFECPSCRAWISKPAAPPTVVELTGLVPITHERPPAEVYERHDGPPISLDDLIELGRQMADTDLLARHAGR